MQGYMEFKIRGLSRHEKALNRVKTLNDSQYVRAGCSDGTQPLNKLVATVEMCQKYGMSD